MDIARNLLVLCGTAAIGVLYCGTMNVLSGKRFYGDTKLARTIRILRGKADITEQ